MKQLIAIALTVAAVSAHAGVNYSNQVTLPTSSSNIVLADAQYDVIPTRTEIRPIPGCNPYGEQGNICEETVVIESQAVIRANISFRDSVFGGGEGNDLSWTSVVFKLSDFSQADVDSLKAVYPPWKHPFSKVGKNFAKNKMSLSTQEVKQTIQVVDMKKSRICPINGETGEKQNPNCQDYLVYKDSWTKVLVVTVDLK